MRHHGLDVGKINVHMARRGDDIGDALNGLPQHVICYLEGFEKGRRLIDNPQQPLVRNHEQGIDMSTQIANALFRMFVPPLPFILEGLRHHTHRENPHLTGDTGNDRRSTGAGPAPHPCRHKDHIRAFEAFADVLFAFQRRFLADFRLRACTQPASPLRSQLNFVGSQRAIQRLEIRIARDEIDPCQTG